MAEKKFHALATPRPKPAGGSARGSLRPVRFAQQLTRNLGLRRGVVLGDDGLILLHRLVAATCEIVHLSGCQLGALLEIELTVGNAGGELVIFERALIVLLAAQALCQTKGGKLDAGSGVLSCFGSVGQFLVAGDCLLTLPAVLEQIAFFQREEEVLGVLLGQGFDHAGGLAITGLAAKK